MGLDSHTTIRSIRCTPRLPETPPCSAPVEPASAFPTRPDRVQDQVASLSWTRVGHRRSRSVPSPETPDPFGIADCDFVVKHVISPLFLLLEIRPYRPNFLQNLRR